MYDQVYPAVVPKVNITNALNYTSPVLHTVVIKELEPNTTYYYSVGDGKNMSEVFEYRSLLAPGALGTSMQMADGACTACSQQLAALGRAWLAAALQPC